YRIHLEMTVHSNAYSTLITHQQPNSTLFPYTTLFRSSNIEKNNKTSNQNTLNRLIIHLLSSGRLFIDTLEIHMKSKYGKKSIERSEEHTSELQSRENLVCRLLLEKKNIITG